MANEESRQWPTFTESLPRHFFSLFYVHRIYLFIHHNRSVREVIYHKENEALRHQVTCQGYTPMSNGDCYPKQAK